MPVWKVFVVLAFGCGSLALGLATIVVPISIETSDRWLWLVGLFMATGVIGSLFALFLRSADAVYGIRPR